jgi:hypothetical protein
MQPRNIRNCCCNYLSYVGNPTHCVCMIYTVVRRSKFGTKLGISSTVIFTISSEVDPLRHHLWKRVETDCVKGLHMPIFRGMFKVRYFTKLDRFTLCRTVTSRT